MRAFLFWLAMRLPCRVISDKNVPYLERYFLAQFCGRRYYLHRFVGSDPDRGLHNHPWRRAWSFLLSGWYFEEIPLGRRRVRWFNRVNADHRHRVIIGDKLVGPPLEVWSLFCHTYPDYQGWGFFRRTIPGGPLLYFPFLYAGKKKDNRWELTAPRGAAIPRDSRGVALPEADMYAGN